MRTFANSRCPRRRDAEATYALLEQARAGLLASVVARDSSLAVMRTLNFERFMDENTERIASQTVRFDSALTARSFAATRAPKDFITAGFTREASDGTDYFAPDADVLLNDDFATGYCFRLATDRNRFGQIGLGFDPATRPRGRVAITGTLWVDTVARALVELEFRYLDLGRLGDAVRSGGRVHFIEVRPGVVLIDRWHIRVPRARADTTWDSRGRPVIRRWIDAVELGAELAAADWPDGWNWEGHFGTLRGRAFRGDSVVAGQLIRLDNTDYSAITDSLGRFEIAALLPGPYTPRVFSPELAEVDLMFRPAPGFLAARDSTVEARIAVPTLADYAREHCGTPRDQTKAPPYLLVVGRVISNGRPVDRAEIRAKWPYQANYFYSFHTGTDGRFEICIPATPAALTTQLVVNVTIPSAEPRVITFPFTGSVTRLPIIIDRPERP